MSSALQLPSSYPAFLAELKERIRVSQIRAAMAVSRELVLLYWSIGREILTRQQAEGWGRASSTGWPAICKPNSQAWKGSALATLNI
jgi:hypothetical protein